MAFLSFGSRGCLSTPDDVVFVLASGELGKNRPNRPPRLILASSSPYRRELLERLRVPFDVVVPAIDETPLAGETPEVTALRLAQAKARARTGLSV